MRGAIVPPDVGLDLNDPSDTLARWVAADQQRTEERPTRLQGWPREDRPIDDGRMAQRNW
jgi:hypothetical protein